MGTANSSPVYIHAYEGICALGKGVSIINDKLFGQQAPSNGVYSQDFAPNTDMFLGLVAKEDTDICLLPKQIPKRWQTRINALIYHGFSLLEPAYRQLSQLINPARIGVVLGSSNAGISQGEDAIAAICNRQLSPASYDYEQQEYGNPAQFLAWLLGSLGPAYTLSTACSSSAKAFISGARLLQQDLCDLVVVGGADVVSQLTAQGFLSLEAVDGARSQPFAKNRKGIHLGEGVALFVLSRQPSGIRLVGWGESSDAHHIAAPQPDGYGAESSMKHALQHANLNSSEIDYLNLHGTATLQNDAMEAQAVSRVFGDALEKETLKVSSTKALTGHTLGAAGAIEALFCVMTLQQQRPLAVPVHHIDGGRSALDPSIAAYLNPNAFATATHNHVEKIDFVMSNSFGFGGSNTSLVFGRDDNMSS